MDIVNTTYSSEIKTAEQPPKKSKKKIIIISAVSAAVLVAIIICVVVFFVACKSKSAISIETFKSKAEAAGMETTDISTVADGKKLIMGNTKDSEGNKELAVFFYEYDDKDAAKEDFENSKSQIESSSSNYSSTEGTNYGSFSANTDGKYIYRAYIENTLFGGECDSSNESKLQDFIDSIGY